MGRAPCCDKANVKKGPWSPEEDAKLKSYIEKHGTGGNWIALPQKIGLKRCGKSCRLRWLNYLRPNIKHGAFSEEEDNIICSLYVSIGSRWSIIAAQLPGRTDNDIKNYWNTRLKKKLLGKQRKEHARRGSNKGIKTTLVGNGNPTVVTSNYFTSHVQAPYWPEQPRSAAQITPKLYSNLEESTLNDHTSLRKLLIKLGGRFSEIRDPQIVHNNNGVITDLQYPIEGSCSSSQNPSYNREEQGVAVLSSFASQLSQVQCSAVAGTTNTNNPCEIEGVDCYSNPHRLDGLEFLLGSEIGGSYHGESISNWGEISSLVYASPSQGPSYELGVHQQDLLQECSFNEMRYTQAR